ncbi:hypothetical protein C8Q72DRAFT_798039 [Fomitopsis betulina]|nr:hypothetical protein C8Q72DRAFT_798039 [Fomitopsis betulina]
MEYLQSILAVPSLILDVSSMDTSSTGSNTTSGEPSRIVLDIFSSTVVPDWAKLFVLGAVVELCRRSFYSFWTYLLIVPWVTVTFDEEDIAFWKARTAEVTTSDFGLKSSLSFRSHRRRGGGDTEDEPISYIPGVEEEHSIWYKYHCIKISRKCNPEMSYGRPHETMQLRLVRFRLIHEILDTILNEAKQLYKHAKVNTISVYTTTLRDEWVHVTSQPRRPLSTIILDSQVKENLLDDAKEFLGSRQWYVDRGIPFRRGYLLESAPPTYVASLRQRGNETV